MIHTTAFIVQANLQFLFLNGTKIAGFVWSVVQRQKYSIHYRRGQRKAAQSRDCATETGTLKTKPRCLPNALPSGFCAQT